MIATLKQGAYSQKFLKYFLTKILKNSVILNARVLIVGAPNKDLPQCLINLNC
jgi:hypothetical protein